MCIMCIQSWIELQKGGYILMRLLEQIWKRISKLDGKRYTQNYKGRYQTRLETSSLEERIRRQERLVMGTSENQKSLELNLIGMRDNVRDLVQKVVVSYQIGRA